MPGGLSVSLLALLLLALVDHDVDMAAMLLSHFHSFFLEATRVNDSAWS